MKIRLLPFKTSLEVSKHMNFNAPLFNIPRYIFGQTYEGEQLSSKNIFKIYNGFTWYIPICFIAEIIP